MESCRFQLEEAEEIAALNLAKYKDVMDKLSEAQERAAASEEELARLKATGSRGQQRKT